MTSTAQTSAGPQKTGVGPRLYEGWLRIAADFGEVQTLIIISLVYGFVMGPVATIAAIGRADFLQKRGVGEPGTAWLDADTTTDPDLERAKRLF